MKKTALFRDNLFVEHDPGFDQPDAPERISTLYSLFDTLPEKDVFVEPVIVKASRETLLLNHLSSVIDKAAATEGQIFSVLDADTFTSAKSYAAACLAAGALVTGVDLLFQNKINNGFALIRPPGHHAEKDRSTGFCLFNNVAIAAHHAIERLGVEKILIVDWDVHHGNGTQNSFYDTDKVLYLSVHQSPLYPGSGMLHETGVGKGEGYTINIPLPGGQGDAEYANIFNTLIAPIACQYQPQLILVSAGFDGYHGDGISSMCLTAQGFAYMTRVLVQLAEKFSGGKVIVSLEGGYSLTGLREGVFAVLGELAGVRLNTPFNCFLDEETIQRLQNERSLHPAIEQVRDVAKNYWKM
jgi:acetoin utilization deacetylase AcuC-like enzyme